ncbi:MAG TPA: hypothetical protein VEZ24_09230 [Microvirga sp.]|nr:hypothetical protein [Microvirga sp.]
MPLDKALENISRRVAVLEDKIVSHRTLISVLRTYLIQTDTIDRETFNNVFRELAKNVEQLGLSTTQAAQFRADVNDLIVDESELRPTFQVIRGGKDD